MHYQQVAFDVVRTALQGCWGNAAWQRQLGFAWKCLMAGQEHMTRFCCKTRLNAAAALLESHHPQQ